MWVMLSYGWSMSSFFFCRLVKMVVDITCLQHKFLTPDKYFPVLRVTLSFFSFMVSTWVFTFLVILKAVIGSSRNSPVGYCWFELPFDIEGIPFGLVFNYVLLQRIIVFFKLCNVFSCSSLSLWVHPFLINLSLNLLNW